jgi:hypothetical protein
MRSILLIIFTVIVLLLTACTGEADPDHTDGSDKADASIEQDVLEDAVPDTVQVDNNEANLVNDDADNSKAEVAEPGEYDLPEGWIYYSNFDDDNAIYRIRTDGSERTKLNDDQS